MSTLPWRQHPFLLVEDGTQEVVGVYPAFHQHVGLAVADKLHRLMRGVDMVVSIDIFYVVVVVSHSLVTAYYLFATHEDYVHEPLV